MSSVMGTHLNMVVSNVPNAHSKWLLAGLLPSGWVLDKEDEAMIFPFSEVVNNMALESGYLHIQATKPDTVGT